VLRPLLTFDKEEIIGLAKQIGTYELSLEEYKDCCAIITRHPRTRVKASLVSEYVSSHRLMDVVLKSLEQATLAAYNPTTGLLRASPLSELHSERKAIKAEL